MRFFTPGECAEWCEEQGIVLEGGRPSRKLLNPYCVCCDFPPKFSQFLWFSRSIESALQPRRECLMWVTGWGIWPSSENEHLYYRFRQSYGDHRLLCEAPGHLCLTHEAAEVITLAYLGMLYGWGVHLITAVGYSRAFVCHDEWVEIGFDDQGQFNESRAGWENAELVASVTAQ